MINYYLPLALTVSGLILYHVAQKSIPSAMNPFLVMSLAYLSALAITVTLTIVFPGKKSLVDNLRDSNWGVFAVGIGTATIELGFLMAYRFGWKISVANLTTNVLVAALLIPIGIFFFKEEMSLKTLAGLGLCVAGLVLLTRE